MGERDQLIVKELLDRYGHRYAEEAGIVLADRRATRRFALRGGG
jgi:hypothetical protein